MIATTIMISTSVKPDLREVWIFICTTFSDVNWRQAGLLYNCVCVHELPDALALPLKQSLGQANFWLVLPGMFVRIIRFRKVFQFF
jgi:hypothetical protein